MSATTHDIFGVATRGEPATPGSYGEPPAGFRLPDATRLGAVKLQVAELARSLHFYQETLGLRVVARDDARAVLAAHDDERPLVELLERAGARPAGRHAQLGLYHFAILLPDRPALGRFVRHLAERGERAGAGDHLVSEALYVSDPDGLGIEVYADRPREAWRRSGRELMMATDPVDLAGLAGASGAEPWRGMPAGTVIGHVHLHVGDLGTASRFYHAVLGFDRMVWSYPGALFLGAGGYHHHLGVNTWAGRGARPPAAEDARLLEWTIELPDVATLDLAAASLGRAGHAVERDDADSVAAHDPWGTVVRLRAPTG